MTRARRRLAIGGIVAALAVGVPLGLAAGTASAHVAPIVASCEAGLVINLTDYDPAGVNVLRVWIDGNEQSSTTFGASASSVFSFGDLFASHTYRVVVSAWDDPDGQKHWSFDTGTKTIPVCAVPTTTAAPTTQPTVSVVVTTPSTQPASTTATTAVVTTAPATTSVNSAAITLPPDGSGSSTTVIVAQAGAVGTTPALASTAPGAPATLPVTGRDDMELLLGLAALLAGAALVLAARRPA